MFISSMTRLRHAVLFISLCVVLSAAAMAGNTGIKVGAALPQWKVAYEQNQPLAIAASPSFAVYLVQEFTLGKYLSLQFEPGYTQQSLNMDYEKSVIERLGNTTLPTTLPDKISYTHTLYSLRCPVLAKIALRESGIRPYFLVGPDLGFSLGAKVSTNIDTATFTLPKSIDITPTAQSTVFSVIAGAGIELQLPMSINIVMDARYVFTPGEVSSLAMFGKTLGGIDSDNILVLAGITFGL